MCLRVPGQSDPVSSVTVAVAVAVPVAHKEYVVAGVTAVVAAAGTAGAERGSQIVVDAAAAAAAAAATVKLALVDSHHVHQTNYSWWRNTIPGECQVAQ